MSSLLAQEMTFRGALSKAKEILRLNSKLVSQNLVDTEAEQIVMAVYRRITGMSLGRLDLYSKSNDEFPGPAFSLLIQDATARSQGKLLQHLTGVQVFLDHEYDVGPEVLVPRPETEGLVIAAMERLEHPQFGIEVGVGSGVISIELLCRFKKLKMLASEFSLPAKNRALQNAEKILGDPSQERLKVLMASHADQVLEPFKQQLWFQDPAEERKAEFIISNPPYLTLLESNEDVYHQEPHAALFAPPEDPFYFYRKIAEEAGDYLVPSGWVFVELPHERALQIMKLFIEKGWSESYVEILNDLSGRPRVLTANLNGRGNN